MKKKKGLKKLSLIVYLFILTSTIFTPTITKAPIIPLFSIDILSPHTGTTRNTFSEYMLERLPLIGIEVDTFDVTGWAQISPRTWGYPGPYPIPPYDQGGYDILFVGWSWDFDFDPTGLYDTAGITPYGDNFMQYSNPEMDLLIDELNNEYIPDDIAATLIDIQELLYEDLPDICLIYPLSCYPVDVNFDQNSWIGVLWAGAYQSMENWTISGQTIFTYATPAEFEDFFIYTYESVYDAQWLEQIYPGLLERSQEKNRGFSPKLIKSYTTTDGLSYNIQLLDNITWADGIPLTTDDVIFSYQSVISPSTTNVYRYEDYITNESVTKISDNEFTITFNKTYIYIEKLLSIPIIPKHIWESYYPDQFESQANYWAINDPSKIFGAGAYVLDYYNYTTDIIQLKENANYTSWSNINPYFDKIKFQFYSSKEYALSALASGAVDMVDAQYSPQLDEIPAGTKYELVDDPGTQVIAINCKHPILGTGELCPIAGQESAKHIRQAISHIAPRDVFIDELYNGLAKPGITQVPPLAFGFDEDLSPYNYSVEAALLHMQAAGYEITVLYHVTTIGYTIPVILLLIGLVGGCQVINLKRKN
ncbi:MAG: hypothetical protein FK734_07180 [Asgard group archaeon]|nr:hypothetical protein [Asgard group archaeon]